MFGIRTDYFETYFRVIEGQAIFDETVEQYRPYLGYDEHLWAYRESA